MSKALPASMRAWRVEQITEVGEMNLRTLALPIADSQQYLVRVEAVGLAFGDTLTVRGKYQVKPSLPFTPGREILGTIVGGLGPLAVGTRIASSSAQGGFAEYTLVPCADAVEVDTSQHAGVVLALRNNFPTSLYALRHAAKLQSGEVLLVHSGAGGVGNAAVQLGKLMGARVIATAGGPRKLQVCRDAGADEVADYRAGDWVDTVRQLAPRGIDVIYDPVGGQSGVESLRCLAYRARYLIIGFAGGTLTQLPANRLLLQGASAIGVLWGEVRKREPALESQLFQDLYQWHREGRLKPLAGQGFAFEAAREALAALAGRATVGKVWLQLDA